MASAAYCDLHTHSTASDGTDAPGDLPRLVKAAGLGAWALTDHDTTAGLGEAAAASKRLGVKFVPGIELSADPDVLETGTSRGTLHVLGYYIEADDPGLAELAVTLRDARAQRNPALIANLNQLGVRIDYDEVLAAAGVQPGSADADTAIIGRPHVAQVLVDKGYVKSIHDAFQKYLGRGGAAFVRKDRLSAQRAIDAIHAAGGVAVLAHPVQLRLDTDTLEHTVARLKDLGLDGLETRHSDHGPADVELLDGFAARFTLLTTGGSDYHGARKAIDLGSQRVPMAVYEELSAVAFR